MRRAALAVAMLAGLLLAPAPGGAQAGRVTLRLPPRDPFPAALTIPVAAETAGFTAPFIFSLEVATTASFASPVFAQAIVSPDSAQFTISRLLPENSEIWVRATVADARGATVGTVTVGPRHTGPHLELRQPVGPLGVAVYTRQPTFVWSAAPIGFPPGPWVFDIQVIDVGSATQALVARDLFDTTYTPRFPLQANTSYRWSVVARPLNGSPADVVLVQSPSTFVISSEGAPIATLLYQNFPNPFPTPFSQSTCIWFDLKARTRVQLTIHTLRGDRVRTLVPGASLPGDLDAGAYGRVGEGPNAGCDHRLEWDGRADDGRELPPGVYLLIFRAGSTETVKKIVYRGR